MQTCSAATKPDLLQFRAAAAQQDLTCLVERFDNGTDAHSRTQACATAIATFACSAGCVDVLNTLRQ